MGFTHRMAIASILASAGLASCLMDFEAYRSSGAEAQAGATSAGGGGGDGGMTAGGNGGEGGQGGELVIPLEPCGSDGLGRCIQIPDGWSGPSMRHDSTNGSQTTCPGNTNIEHDGRRGLVAMGGCSNCSCNKTCNFGAMTSYPLQSDCGGTNGSYTPASSCNNFQAQHYPMSVRIDPPTTSCTPSGGNANFDPPSWTYRGTVCAAPQASEGECAAGVCVEALPQPFEDEVCFWRVGDEKCPIGFAKLTYYDGFNDTRSCTTCSCSVSADCTATTTLRSNVGCGGGMQVVQNDGACHTTGSRHSFRGTMSGGSCNNSGGQQQGAASPDESSAFTLCCAP
jgi:hypothetical protein